MSNVEHTANKIVSSLSFIGVFFGGVLGVIGSFCMPISNFLVITCVLVIVDLIFGIRAAQIRKEKIRSFGIRRTLDKFLVYLGVILASRGIVVTFAPEVMQSSMYITWIISGTICVSEITSIYENAEEITGVSFKNVLSLIKNMFAKSK